MEHPTLPATATSVPTPRTAFDLSLFRIGRLGPDGLDRLVAAWLGALRLHGVRLWERRGHISTYEALLGEAPTAVRVRVRVHQRLRALRVHHVEAFLGHLARSGSPVGILVTTGTVAWAAGIAARSPQNVFLRVCDGEEWAEELALHHLIRDPRRSIVPQAPLRRRPQPQTAARRW